MDIYFYGIDVPILIEFLGQFSLLLQYGILKKLVTYNLLYFVDMGSVDFGSRLQGWFREGISVPPGTGLIDVASVFGIELQFCRLLS